jgi:hypothetical protein
MLAFTPDFALGADAAMMAMIRSKLIVASVPRRRSKLHSEWRDCRNDGKGAFCAMI